MSAQRIGRLMPLKDLLARVAALAQPVAPVDVRLDKALYRVAAEDVVARQRPTTTVASRDGYAVSSDATADASSYAPVPLAGARVIETGEPLPAGTDAVLPDDAVDTAGAGVQALAMAARGDGTLPAGIDAGPDQPIRIAGTLLRQFNIAALAATGVAVVKVRTPRVRIVAARKDPVLREVVSLLAGLVVSAGGEVTNIGDAPLDAVLRERGARLIIIVGGSGSGARDRSVSALAEAGRVEAHGIGLIPGETAALGAVEDRPVLIVPGRLDAALAVWVTVGEAMLRALTGQAPAAPAVPATLARKITSTIGMVEVVPVRLQQSQATPLASGYWPLQAQAIADGYVVVPAESEGFAEGAAVAVRMVV